jgi:hypothetical protein
VFKIVSESPEEIETEARWIGEINGFNGFPDGKKVGSGHSLQGANGVTMSNWQDIFTTNDQHKLTFTGHDMNRNGSLALPLPCFNSSSIFPPSSEGIHELTILVI